MAASGISKMSSTTHSHHATKRNHSTNVMNLSDHNSTHNNGKRRTAGKGTHMSEVASGEPQVVVSYTFLLL